MANEINQKAERPKLSKEEWAEIQNEYVDRIGKYSQRPKRQVL